MQACSSDYVTIPTCGCLCDVGWRWSVLFGSNNLPLMPNTCSRFALLNSVVGYVLLHNISAMMLTPNVSQKCTLHMFHADINTKLTNETALNG
jgi:hypothetical protein